VIVKDDLMCVFYNFYEHGLFEKIGQLEVGDFKPISLMGSVCNILAKVLA
jgi:hypothetical protein